MNAAQAERWARSSATAGAVVWALLAALAGARKAPLGVIELLFLFAPLVIVPLGLELGRVVAPVEPHRGEETARILQPLAAGLAVASFWFSPGWTAGALVAPWVMVGALMAVAGLLSLLKGTDRSLVAVAANVGRMNLAVASGWLLVSRFGIRPMGFREPIVLLTAVHFHYTGFATALLAATAAAFAQRRGRRTPLLRLVVVLVFFLPFLLAAGFVFSPTLKLAAALALSASMVGLAGLQFWLSKDLRSRTARGFLQVSAVALIAGMMLAAAYELGEAKDWLLIPRMASTQHGLFNGLGFVLLGLLGWLVEWPPN
jgi:hypothetical protein